MATVWAEFYDKTGVKVEDRKVDLSLANDAAILVLDGRYYTFRKIISARSLLFQEVNPPVVIDAGPPDKEPERAKRGFAWFIKRGG